MAISRRLKDLEALQCCFVVSDSDLFSKSRFVVVMFVLSSRIFCNSLHYKNMLPDFVKVVLFFSSQVLTSLNRSKVRFSRTRPGKGSEEVCRWVSYIAIGCHWNVWFSNGCGPIGISQHYIVSFNLRYVHLISFLSQIKF